jgi:hypothetical protein
MSVMQDLEENPLLDVLQEFSTAYKVEKCVKNDPAFKYVEPVEHKIKIETPCGEKEIKVVYISVSKTLENVVAALKKTKFPEEAQQKAADLLMDIKDGLAYKSNTYFRENPDAYTLMFYGDAYDITNPLGARKGIHKIVNIYWTIAELPKHLRSKTENWFLALSIKDSDLKLCRGAVEKLIVDDLLLLEEGIPVAESILKAGLLCYIGDNLEAHLVGGFSPVFSSSDICRMCHMQFADLPTVNGVLSAKKWTAAEYDSIVNDPNKSGHCGLKQKCSFNELQSFHAVGQLPFDPLHDFLEKVGACDAHAALLTLEREGDISIVKYNELLGSVKLEDYEVGDRPLPVNTKAEKLCGKALSVSLHLRLMPLILSRLLPDEFDSDLLDILLMLSKLNEYILADCFSLVDVINFKELIIEYLDKRAACLSKYPAFKKITPKYHYLEHYSDQIMNFGPFTCTWTARCESRHRDFVNFAESSKNFINVIKTLATKNQKKMASRTYSGLFVEPLIQFPAKKFSPAECRGSLPGNFQKKVCLFFLPVHT